MQTRGKGKRYFNIDVFSHDCQFPPVQCQTGQRTFTINAVEESIVDLSAITIVLSEGSGKCFKSQYKLFVGLH